MLVDVKKTHKVDGARAERVLELAGLIANKNTVPSDKSALVPSGIRLGTPAFTTRGANAKDFEQVAELFDKAIGIAQKLQTDPRLKGTKLADFKALLNVADQADMSAKFPELGELRSKVVQFARKFPTIGY
jgi:glycine hydroxymethyltransferase